MKHHSFPSNLGVLEQGGVVVFACGSFNLESSKIKDSLISKLFCQCQRIRPVGELISSTKTIRTRTILAIIAIGCCHVLWLWFLYKVLIVAFTWLHFNCYFCTWLQPTQQKELQRRHRTAHCKTIKRVS